MMCSKNITQALEALGQERSSAISSICCELAVLLTSESFSYEKVVEQLADYIIFAENVPLFRKHLSSILLALVSTKIPLKPVFSDVDFEKVDFEKKNHIEFSITLSLLSEHPDILQYALKYFAINSVLPFEAYISLERGYNHTPKRRRHSSRPSITEHAIVQCCHTLLSKLPNELSSKWDWANFIAHFWEHENAEIRLMIKECMVILTNMTNSQSRQLSSILNITHKESLKPKLHTNKCIIPSSIEKTNIFQGPEVANEKNKKDIASFDTFEIVGDKGQFKLVNKEKFGVLRDTTGVVNIDGILLPIYSKSNVQKGSLVRVKSTLNNLRSLALAVASGKALCLMGPVGSGKTSLVEYLASITGRKGVAFKKVQLGDQTDSRMLLGSHQCTDVPGEFVWRPGVLTEAVQNGDWLLLEDIDCAALDVASTLSSLLERNALCVPGYRDSLPVTPGFQLFVTQRTLATNYGFQKKMTNSSALLQKHLTQINVEPLSRTELGEVIQTLYPALTSICSRMIEVFMMFSVGSHDTSLQTTEFVETDSNVQILRGSRLTSTRDLIKWCARAVQGFDVSSPSSAVKVLKDALDIFTRSVASPDHRLQLAKKVGTCLGIVETEAEYYCKHYKPVVGLEPTALEVGRAKIPRQEKSLQNIDFDNKQVVFSFTRQSACLLESIACCVAANEPVLLVGETGTGKTSSIQYLAKHTGNKLIVINMNQQSDSADLLGGYKPVDFKYVIRPLTLEFEELFRSLYNIEKNEKFLSHINTCFESESWTALVTLMKHAHKAAISKLENETKLEINSKTVKTSSSKDVVDKLVHEKKVTMLKSWLFFGRKLVKLEQQVKAASRLSFAFIEGSLVKAMQEGNWVLLDEINLASPEILECIAGLLEDKNETIDLLEKGDKVPIKRHENFTLFACMNPATDVGKKDLPVGLRNRFTEFYVDELIDKNDLVRLIGDYLYHMNLGGAMLEAIYSFYSTIRKEAKLSLVDGAGNAPHYSLRTLCRALTAAAKANCGTVARSLFEAFCLSFLTQLDSSSHPKVEAMVAKAVLGKKNIKSVMNQLIPEPQVRGQNYLLFEGHWIPQGKLEIVIPEGYILTPTVRKNLRDIARIISLGRLPVLLQGDTSVGKTSLITYIAKASGNYCVRINNHEHTDLQEYIGSYAADASGKLVFKEGVLVEAMRKGYWIILDELNLAPSDVLEALNRVLDDNRELFIPETQQVVKADTNFMLFATQNPPGLYGGRKMLSRAFRNRFVELHFDEIPRDELETILHKRCHVPPTYSKKMIAVMAELQIRRRGSAAVQGKDGFITLRDLFRWGQRYKHASKEMLTEDKFYDWDQHLADEGYLVLAGKVRQTDERKIIEEVIEKHINRKVYPENLFNLHQTTSPVTKPILEMILNNQLKKFSHVVWTYNMRRLAVLIAKAFSFNEPVLLVGVTGCGKTTICQVLATLKRRQLLSVNCHMHTESSDFLGGLRPVRQHKNDGRLFEWMDGPLIKAMESGDMFLADEISLADDSVLERLNSLLEPERQLVLAERGIEENSDIVVITAVKNFHFIGTMNPGGDFGKKELSPALRNRFTEIWCDSVTSREDLQNVLEKSVSRGISLGNQEDGSSGVGSSILDFTEWLKNIEVTSKFPFSIRDLLSWVQFINTTVNKGLLETPEAYVHGACMTFLDCFGTALTGHIDSETLFTVRKTAIDFLLNQIKTIGNEYTDSLREMLSEKQTKFHAESDSSKFGIRPFYIDMGADQNICEEETQQFTFTAPTTGSNTLRLLRGLQLNKAILLEGNPGVGKTSLVTALAKSSGHKVVRINLSDQTDITDLFGTDLPTEDGSFTFKEGAFLSALQNGDWILLDELNLAPQPVLEGLNACLDHRGEVFIPELGKSFKVKPQTRLFACQNPLKQGGARRGLPVSFLNRFIQVYVDTLTKEDLLYIVESQYSSLPKDILHRIVDFNCKVAREVTETQAWGHRGAPWEMNLRDIQRWCEALIKDQKEGLDIRPGKFVDMLYINRMRTFEDKEKMTSTYDKIFHPQYPRSDPTPQFDIDDKRLVIGDVTLNRNIEKTSMNRHAMETNLLVLRNQISTLKSLAQSVKMNWLTILVGQTATGKSSAVQVLADLTGNDLQCIPVTSAMDVSDLLGGFEQVDYNRNLEIMYDKIEILTTETVRNLWLGNNLQSNNLLSQLHEYKNSQAVSSENEIEKFKEKIQFLLQHSDKLIKYNKTYSASLTKLQQIVSSLNSLNTKLCNMSTVNAGGKFEWVDSVLVKTMSEGSWLLLDNVNLTSAAVLDRLNGLLEPNGVLSIPERGEFSEITPHPNFRVFFTMDPKYGEISRAMRNRGVEICLLKPDECNTNFSETMSSMDLTALLSSCGLPKSYHALCIECHEAMASFIQGFDQPTLSHLLQAAHMTWQQIVRGLPHNTALKNSFSDVYIKPRCGGDFASDVRASLAEMKNSMLKTLEKILEKITFDIQIDSNTLHTLTVKGLCSDSLLEKTIHIAYPAIQELTDKFGNALNKCYSYFVTYKRCPKECLGILHDVLKEMTETNQAKETGNLAIELNKMCEFLEENNPEACKRFSPESNTMDTKTIKEVNRKTVILFIEISKLFTLKSINKHANSLSALDYSRTVASGALADEFNEYPILKNCEGYLQLIDKQIQSAVNSAEDSLDDENTCRILQLLNWRHRFVVVCSEPLFYKNKKTFRVEEVVPLLDIHCKWVEKNLINELHKLSPHNVKEIGAFNKIVEQMKSQNEIDNSEMAKMGKKLRKLYGQPKLYKDQKEYDLCVARNSIYDELTLDMGQPIEKQLNKLTTHLCCTNSSLALDVPVRNQLEEIQGYLAQSHVMKNNSDIKLLPINAYVVQRVFTILMREVPKILSRQSSLSEELLAVIANLVHLGTVSQVFSPALLNTLQLVKQPIESEEMRISSLPSTFWTEVYKSMVNSPALYPLPFFNLVDLDSEDDVMLEIPTHTKRVSTNLPLMPYYVQQLTVSDNEGSRHILAYETISLESRAKYSEQLGAILNILWKNIATVDTSASLKLLSDAKFEMNKYEVLISYIHSILTPETFDQNPLKNPIQILKEYFKDDSYLIDIMVESNKAYKALSTAVQTPNTIDKFRVKILTMEVSLLTSLMFLKVMSEMNSVDHVERYRLKVKYIHEDIQMFETLLSAYYMQGLVSGTVQETKIIERASDVTIELLEKSKDDLKRVHPYCSILMEMKERTAEKIEKYATGNTFRPTEPSYSSFVKDCKHFTKSVLSAKTTKDLSINLISTCNVLYLLLQDHRQDKQIINKARTVLKETASWLYSASAFSKKIDNYSNAFPDLAKPLQSSISQIVYSVTSLNDLIRESIVKIEQGQLLREVVENMMVYPSNIPPKFGKEKFLNRFVTSEVMQLVRKNVIASNDDSMAAELESLELLKMNLLELQMHSIAKECTDDVIMASVVATLGAIVKTWEKQQRDVEKKKQDDEALYVTKSKCEDEDEEGMAYEERLEMFPTYTETDFGEFKPPTLEQKPQKPTQSNTNKLRQLISSEDVTLVYKWHSSYLKNLTLTEWLPGPKKMISNDVITPFLERYPIFSRIIESGWEALDADIEGVLSPSLMVIISQIKEKVDGTEPSSSKLDFYRSPWVSETRQCVPLLYKVKDATNTLLDQWPDFPTLKDIITIVNRILGFPVTSPISRFLTGLELLRDKIEEWNKNAHKGNNMIDISLEVGQQIINWRKLEMGHWKECLNNLYNRKQSEAHKYWFYMYSVVTSYLDTNIEDPISSDRVISVLKDFMETSNLAEYEVRLDIVYVYHCHLVHLKASSRRDELVSILWNTYNYYSQFSNQVASYIKEKRAPIEKKLRDFVKICTWDRDLSYWSVKDTVEKAHKALHKHTKEFENILKESVARCLIDNTTETGVEHVGIWDRPKRATGAGSPTGGAYMVDSQNYLVLARNVKHYLDQSEKPSAIIAEGSLLSKIPSLLNKAKALCKDTMTNTSYPSLVQGLDDFVTMVIETSTHLGSLEIDATSPKDKQKSQAKNIVQQKRKALADLFKYLSKMGLNYRTGLVILSANESLYDFTIPPVNLDAAISYLKSRRCDASLAMLWSGCEQYFQKNIVRHRLLAAGLVTPHQDLGMQNIERCKGFAAQLLKLTNGQKKSIAKYSRHLYDLRTLVTNLTNALDLGLESDVSGIGNQISILTECFANTEVLLDQFSVVLKSCPENSLGVDNLPNFDAILSNSPIVRCYKNSDEWKDLYGTVKKMISITTKQNTALHKLTNATPKCIGRDIKNDFISDAHVNVSINAISELRNIAEAADSLLEKYQIKYISLIDAGHKAKHPILNSIVHLSTYLRETLNELGNTESNTDDVSMTDDTSSILQQTEDLTATILLIIQSVYKKNLPLDKTIDNSDVISAIDEIISETKEKEESKEILEDNHLKELLQERLSSDSRMLQLQTLVARLEKLLINYVQYIAENRQDRRPEVINAVQRLVPILEQMILFVQYFVTQKVAVHRVSCKMLSVLLKIFTDLATKGFCKPSDLDMEEGEGDGGPGKLSSGTGLGDGEGQKDVSDRIENQDQLDDAKQPGEEKNEEDRDCKEEEKGVNMTDDFDSHLQDVDKKDGENSDKDDDDDDDPDKQMGDIDNAADKLDQQIWGSEDEEDPEEQSKNEKEDKGKGESTGEKEMAAKEQEQGTDDGEEGKEKKKKKDINEMEEPEVDDDHVDPYHGNQQPMPEPEDFEMPDNMDLDGEEPDEKEGETETENPFEIDVMKENLQEEKEDTGEEEKENRNGLDVSSDEEDDGKDDKQDNEGDKETEDSAEYDKDKTQDDEKNEGDEGDDNTDDVTDQAEKEPETADATEEAKEEEENENLPANNEKMTDEDEQEQKNQETNPQANPSSDDPSAGEKAENAQMDKGTDDNVDTNAEQVKDEESAPFEQVQEQVGDEKQSTGRSELDKSDKGHRGERQATSTASAKQEKRTRHENKPGKTDQERTLGDVKEKKQKQSHTLNVEKEDTAEEGGDQDQNSEQQADAYQHVKQAKKDDLQAIDAATKEQAEQQPTLQQDDENGKELKEDEQVAMDVDEDDLQVEKSEELKPEKLKEGTEKQEDKSGSKKEGGDEPTGETAIEVEGDAVATYNVMRGNETTYHTRLDQLDHQSADLSVHQYMSIREWLHTTPQRSGGGAGVAVWRGLWQECGGAARALCERLRLVLEPTGRSRRAGDFRTGRAINMRRVIPYIASHFRKDRIWLRRTKPAKREYKIAIAVDDSSSMSDNRSKELAFESLALVSQALNLLESGEIAVLSFGEQPNLLHPFTEQFSEHSGSKILEQLTFQQTKTKIAQLLDFCTVMFEEQSVRSDAINAKLLLVVSDGRGIFSEGETKVTQAVRRARQQGIFLVYVIIDNPDNKDSIMDIRKPLLDPTSNKLVGFVQYLDTFPFPFYLILRDMSALPTVLGDALRQWFELAANTN